MLDDDAVMSAFTIHSGYILSLSNLEFHQFFLLFTIHSGYILSKKAVLICIIMSLYNPLWLYSLYSLLFKNGKIFDFTIHSGYILSKIVVG